MHTPRLPVLTLVKTPLNKSRMSVLNGLSWVTLKEELTSTKLMKSSPKKPNLLWTAVSRLSLCIGETLEEKQQNITLQVVQRQLQAVLEKVQDWTNVVVAYEPVWAIGTGLAATAEDAQDIHHSIREFLAEKLSRDVADSVRILYGGSANGKNAVTFKDKADVDGFLVGGASLKPEFVDIINSRV
uniref:Triosephosphate isomerase n=1 Tax=Kluyveromyces lactis TaxID=28985 RepID=Q9URS2_KLULC|nr:triosephosphate isomerase [Kluyveromyces lactis]